MKDNLKLDCYLAMCRLLNGHILFYIIKNMRTPLCRDNEKGFCVKHLGF